MISHPSCTHFLVRFSISRNNLLKSYTSWIKEIFVEFSASINSSAYELLVRTAADRSCTYPDVMIGIFQCVINKKSEGSFTPGGLLPHSPLPARGSEPSKSLLILSNNLAMNSYSCSIDVA